MTNPPLRAPHRPPGTAFRRIASPWTPSRWVPRAFLLCGLLSPVAAQTLPATPAPRPAASPLPTRDFSYAGYAFGAQGIPEAESLGLPILHVTDFGAVPDDGLSDRAAIEAAIHAAGEQGGGIVRFPLGTFRINEEDGQTEPIELLHRSNIVLSGTRVGSETTHVFMRYPLYPREGSSTPEAMIQFKTWGGNGSTDVISSQVPGDRVVRVSSTAALAPGDFVRLVLEGAPELNDRFLKGLPTRPEWSNVNENGVFINELHRIESVLSGDRVRFHAPITVEIEATDGYRLERTNAIEHIGIEDIQFEGNYTQTFQHHQPYGDLGPWYHNDSFKMILVLRGYNSWIRRCTFSNISSPFHFGRSLACTFLSNRYEGNPGHNWGSFGYGSARCLDALSEITSAVWHGPALNNAAGCVSWRTNAPTVRGVDYHGNSVRYNLVDLGVFRGMSSHGAHYSNLPNHLDGAVYWNYHNVGPPLGVYDFWGIGGSGQYPSGVTSVRPRIIGYQGSGATFLNAGEVRSQGTPVDPPSLYEAQLAQRFGSTPPWVGRTLREHEALYRTGGSADELEAAPAPLQPGGR